jgi:tetratricopeptide (TPR) repeat protein
MKNLGNNPDRPVGRYQDFIDATLGSDMSQSMENHHAARVLEAIDYADQGNYAEAADLFLMASNTATTEAGQRYCQTLAKGAIDANTAYENFLANAASETRAKEKAKTSWNTLSKELSVYLNFLGVYFCERKKYSEAIQYYDRAIKINPSYAMAYFSRGGTKADLRLFDEAIHDIKKAVQLFADQNDLPNYQNAQKILQQLQGANSNLGRKQAENTNQLQEDVSKKNFGSYKEMLYHAAQLKAFSIEIAREFPTISQAKQKELAAGLIFKYLGDKYDDLEKKYTDLDREFMKAICFQQGLDLNQHDFRKKSFKNFSVGFFVGGLVIYVITKFIFK